MTGNVSLDCNAINYRNATINEVDILLTNTQWMLFNVSLALIAVMLCVLFLYSKHHILRWFYFCLWVLYVPNTVYLLTDIQYLPTQLSQVDPTFFLALLLQYAALMAAGILTYLAALGPIDHVAKRKLKLSKEIHFFIVILFNFLLGFGMVLGKLERVHSWDVFIKPVYFFEGLKHALFSAEALILSVFFGILANATYFFFRKFLYGSWLIKSLVPSKKRF